MTAWRLAARRPPSRSALIPGTAPRAATAGGRRALGEASESGIPTTLPVLRDNALDAPFVEGRYTTAYLVERADHLPSLREERSPV